MPRLRVLLQRLRGAFSNGKLEQEFDEELRTHIDMQVDDNQTRGMAPDEARRAALREFGGVEQIRETHRARRSLPLIETLLQDLRYTARMLAKSPGFTAAAALSLALGIGGNAAMFSLVNATLIRPLPYPQPDRLVRVTNWYARGAIVALQQQSQTMEIAAYSPDSEFNLTGQGEAVHLAGSSVTANLFSLLGAPPEIGRTFQAGEDRAGADRIVILSHALWQNKFAGDPAVIGRPIAIDGVTREVVGVMPPEFSFPSTTVQMWTPLHLDPSDVDGFWGFGWMPLIGRLRPGASLQQAQGEIHPMISRIIPMMPFTMPDSTWSDTAVMPLQDDMVGDMRSRLLVLLCAVGFVLLIACANVASLLLARTAARQREMAIRSALGAGPGRIMRQLLTESVALGIAGGGLGLLLAFEGLSVVKSVLPADNPRVAAAGIDWRVLAFVAGLAVVTGLVFGLAPALSARRVNLAESLKTRGQQASGASGLRLRGVLIVGEVALAVVLVIGAGLLIKTLWRLLELNPGFNPEQVLTVRVTPNQASCQDPSACVALYEELVRRARGIGGVTDVAAANTLPLSPTVPAIPVELEDHPLRPTEEVGPMFWAAAITPEYLPIMRIPLLEGRSFTTADGTKAAPVALVSAATARRYWPGQSAIGKHVRAVWPDQPWRTVVGVVGDVRESHLADNTPDWTRGSFYMPYPQSIGNDRKLPAAMTLVLRTQADPGPVASEVRRLVANLNPNVPVAEVRTMDAVVAASISQPRSLMWLFVAFGGSALVLAAIGTYGVVSYSAAQRTHEIGVRVALGASRANIFGMVLGQSLRLVLTGLGMGAAAALGLTRLMSSLLYGVTATDPLIFLSVGVLLTAVAVLAGYLPARRAASVDPLTALRVD